MCIDIQNMWDGSLAQDFFVEKRRYALLFTVTKHFRTSLVISCSKDITEKIMRILYCLKITSILRIDFCDARPFCSALLKVGYLF